ncbi:MAG: hypothetical protein ACK559_07705, partial [bacterium]
AGERPPSSVREGIGPVPLSATDPGRKMRGAVGPGRPRLTATKADRIETSCNKQRPTAARSVEGSPDIDVERHSCGATDQQARLAAMKERLVSAEADLVPAEADRGSAEERLVPAV